MHTQPPARHACSPEPGSCRKASDQPSQRLGVATTDDPQAVTACDINLNRALRRLGVRRWGRVFGLRPVHNLDREKARRLSNLDFNNLSIRRKLGITQPFMDQVGVHCVSPRNLRHRHTLRKCLRADRHLLLIRPEPLLLTLLARHICPQDVHYRWWTLSTHSMTRQSSEAGRLRYLVKPGRFTSISSAEFYGLARLRFRWIWKQDLLEPISS